MHQDLTQWLNTQDYGHPTRVETLAGGCINRVSRLYFKTGTTLVLKENGDGPSDMFPAEAAGLDALAQTKTLRVPEVIATSANYIVLEDLGFSTPNSRFWQQLGSGLAALHAKPATCFGFTGNNYCGATVQINSASNDGWEFFARHRLSHLSSHCYEAGLLDSRELDAVTRIADNLQQWIPAMPPVLIHGDLWSGNIHCDAAGAPALIDPACYWGWAEADLAMTVLFGGFSQDFYDAYTEYSGLATSWRERAPLYNLYHLLNHLLMFGTSYKGQVLSICKHFSKR